MPKSILNNLSAIEIYANAHDWKITGYTHNGWILRLENIEKNCKQMQIYLSTLTVQTSLIKHHRGKLQLTRKGLDIIELEKVFINPREHTKKGYYR